MIRTPGIRRGISIRSLNPLRAFAMFAAAVPIVVLGASAAGAAGPNTSFAFHTRDITGSSGAVTPDRRRRLSTPPLPTPPTREAVSAAPHR